MSIKMSDVFDLPLESCAHNGEITDKQEHVGEFYEFVDSCEDSAQLAKAAIQAINSHDRLVEENEKLKAENEQLNKELNDAENYIQNYT